jgi:hypothetical protein
MSFITTLRFQDLQNLREVVRKVYMANFEARHISDRECDKMIDSLGQDTLEKELVALIDGRAEGGVNGATLIPDDRPDMTEQELRVEKAQWAKEEERERQKAKRNL